MFLIANLARKNPLGGLCGLGARAVIEVDPSWRVLFAKLVNHLRMQPRVSLARCVPSAAGCLMRSAGGVALGRDSLQLFQAGSELRHLLMRHVMLQRKSPLVRAGGIKSAPTGGANPCAWQEGRERVGYFAAQHAGGACLWLHLLSPVKGAGLKRIEFVKQSFCLYICLACLFRSIEISNGFRFIANGNSRSPFQLLLVEANAQVT